MAWCNPGCDPEDPAASQWLSSNDAEPRGAKEVAKVNVDKGHVGIQMRAHAARSTRSGLSARDMHGLS